MEVCPIDLGKSFDHGDTRWFTTRINNRAALFMVWIDDRTSDLEGLSFWVNGDLRFIGDSRTSRVRRTPVRIADGVQSESSHLMLIGAGG